MRVDDAEIVISAVGSEQYPAPELPEFALAGRSNVGKSSFINKMIARRRLARTSSKPGRTQTLNFYLINSAFYFVDMPGYGYAKVSKRERERWGRFIEEYLTHRPTLKAVIQIIDIRHRPTEQDLQMTAFLNYVEIPKIIIATKADKIPKGKVKQHVQRIEEDMQLEGEVPVIPFSAETGRGLKESWAAIQLYLT